MIQLVADPAGSIFFAEGNYRVYFSGDNKAPQNFPSFHDALVTLELYSLELDEALAESERLEAESERDAF